MSGKLYCNSPEREIEIIILKGDYTDYNRLQHKYSQLFDSGVNFRAYSKDFLNSFWSNHRSYDSGCVHVFLMGTDLSYQEEADFSRNFKNIYVDNFVFADSDSFKDFSVKSTLKNKILNNCYCDSLDLFRFGCKCGGC